MVSNLYLYCQYSFITIPPKLKGSAEGLATGAIIGISVGAVIGFLILVVVITVVVTKKRVRHEKGGVLSYYNSRLLIIVSVAVITDLPSASRTADVIYEQYVEVRTLHEYALTILKYNGKWFCME